MKQHFSACVDGGLAFVDSIAAKAVIFIMGVMVAVVSAQVALRYGFNNSIDWADEISRLCFVWLIFLAIPLGIRRGAHIGIELLTVRLPPRFRDSLYRVMVVLAAGLAGIVCVEGFRLTLDQWDEPMPTISAPIALFMLPIGIGMAHSVVHLLRLAVRGEPQKGLVIE